jgi:hypothetical protein
MIFLPTAYRFLARQCDAAQIEKNQQLSIKGSMGGVTEARRVSA